MNRGCVITSSAKEVFFIVSNSHWIEEVPSLHLVSNYSLYIYPHNVQHLEGPIVLLSLYSAQQVEASELG